MSLLKRIFVPYGNNKELTAFESWTVRWESRHGYTDLYFKSRQEVEVFTNEKDAIEFAEALKQAAKLLKDSVQDINIKVEKTK